MTAALVPEVDVTDIEASLAFYAEVLGFQVRYARPQEGFVYLVRDGAELMLEAAAGPGRRFRTAPLKVPFGRGVNMQIRVRDTRALLAAARVAGAVIVLDLEDRWYRTADGYLLRFFEDLGFRPVA